MYYVKLLVFDVLYKAASVTTSAEINFGRNKNDKYHFSNWLIELKILKSKKCKFRILKCHFLKKFRHLSLKL